MQDKRRLVKEVYDSKKWSDRVDKMSDSQVIAVFLRLKSKGKIA